MVYRAFLCLSILTASCSFAEASRSWLETHRIHILEAESGGVTADATHELPSFIITPDKKGLQLIRLSLPFLPGSLSTDLSVQAICEGQEINADLRVLSCHPGKPRSVRRGLLTFLFYVTELRSYRFTLRLVDHIPSPSLLLSHEQRDSRFHVSTRLGELEISPEQVSFHRSEGDTWEAGLIAPARRADLQPELEIVEEGAFYLWIRMLMPDEEWPRIIDLRIDGTGGIALWASVQRMIPGNGYCDDLGWTISGLHVADTARHVFTDGIPASLYSGDQRFELRFPRAAQERRGYVEADHGVLRFLRCEKSEQVPFQASALRSAAFSIDPAGSSPRNALLAYTMDTSISPEFYNTLYGFGLSTPLNSYPILEALRQFTRQGLIRSRRIGDDFGNVTSYSASSDHGVAYGMNRLNHCPALFFEGWRSNDAALVETAVLWCENMHDLSIWWWPDDTIGGTRYNNAGAAKEKEHADDPNFMWRTNRTSTFCTKGMDAFFLAYEETGDPRFMTALNAQLKYAQTHLHVNTGEARNIGDVSDFMALYRYTGNACYLKEASRLFDELHGLLDEDYLFSQGGEAIQKNLPFIDDDARGYHTPFGKPYILGYALAGLPALLTEKPDTPDLFAVIRAVANFLAEAQDPLGGWRYPHPRSTWMIIDQGMEHSAQLARAAQVLYERGESISDCLNAIERALAARIQGFIISGNILCGLAGWEKSTGLLEEQNIYDLYKSPEDRDFTRDYEEGDISLDYSSPEGLAHFFETLNFYLEHRPVERLFQSNDALAKVLARIPERGLKMDGADDRTVLHFSFNNRSILELRDEMPLPLLAAAAPARCEEASAKALSWVVEDDQRVFNKSVTVAADMAHWSYTWSPKEYYPPSQIPMNLNVVFHPVAADSVKAYTVHGPCAPGALSDQQPLLLTGSFDEEGVVGLLLSNGRAWRRSSENSNEIEITLDIAFRGDGPVTMQGFVCAAHSEKELLQFFHTIQNKLTSKNSAPSRAVSATSRYGMRAMLPAFHEARIEGMDFPLAWRHAGMDFAQWRVAARNRYLDSLLPAPESAPFETKLLAVEDRGSYEARKLALNLSCDERVTAYLLVPKGGGPFPAVLALHDHGAHFTIGKEKVIRPFNETKERLEDAQQWVEQCYGGRFIGDVLADEGYVVFAADALFWGDRGRREGVQHEAQQELAANILQLGQSWAGIITWDDLRCARFLQSLPEVVPDRIGAVGLSMGAHRCWNLCAATDIVKVGAAICWLGDTPTLMSEGNNQTRGQSAFTMTHPGLRNFLDYPDVASIACPKPMLFYNGSRDPLFPEPGVTAAFDIIREVYESQGVADRLETRVWDVPHVFNVEMQHDAFSWLNKHLK
ncbi:MAG: dienelactone hydrolase family protein [Candidatus Hydrogenedentales bacterium]|jgi:dienelactone hydrolase